MPDAGQTLHNRRGEVVLVGDGDAELEPASDVVPVHGCDGQLELVELPSLDLRQMATRRLLHSRNQIVPFWNRGCVNGDRQ